MNYLAMALAVALGLAGLGLWHLDGKVDKAQAQTAEVRSQLGAERTARQGFQATAKTCGDAVGALQVQAAERASAHAATERAAAKARALHEAFVAELLTSPRPEGLDECQATLKELDNEIDRRRARGQ